MKSCPQCNRTFEDSFTFCLIDGSVLSAPFDPHATLASPEPRQTEQQLLETLKFDEDIQEIPTIIRSPQPEQKPEGLNSKIAAITPTFEPSQIKDSPAPPPPPARKSKRLPLMIGALATFFVIGVVVLILANRTDSTRREPLNENAATVNPAANYSVSSTNSNSANSGASSDTDAASSNQPALTTKRAAVDKPTPSPSPLSARKAAPIPTPSVNPVRKKNRTVATPAKPDDDSTAPCAGKAYQVCEPNETRRCNAATGRWECRRTR